MNFTCTRCKKEFDTRDELLEHRTYPCQPEGYTDFCAEKPKLQPTALKQHVCNVCGKKFDSVFGLNGHMKVHYGRPRKTKVKQKPVPVADDVPDARMVCPECNTLWEIYGPVEMEVCPTCSSDLFAVGETRTVRVVVQ